MSIVTTATSQVERNGRPCELIVVRHGETEWNRQGRMQGHLNSALTETGRMQASALAERLARESFVAVYSSDLDRAYDTARSIVERTGHEVIVDSALRERNLGVFQGLTWPQIREQHAEAYHLFTEGDADAVIPDGESRRQTHERLVNAFKRIAAHHHGDRVLVVAHGGVLATLLRHTLGLPIVGVRRYQLFNASYNSFFVFDDHWELGTWGDVSHLQGIDTIDDY